MKTYSLRTNNPNFRNMTDCAFDYNTFKEQGGLPLVSDLLSVKVFDRGFKETITLRVDSKPFYDKRSESEIRDNPYVSSQVEFGHPGQRVHRVVFRAVSLY
jgi:hypothetical protein